MIERLSRLIKHVRLTLQALISSYSSRERERQGLYESMHSAELQLVP